MSILSGPTGSFGGWKDGPKREYDGKHSRKDDGHDWKSKDDRHDGDKDGGKHGRKDDDHDWKSKDDRHDGKDGDKHARKDDCDNGNDNGNHQDDCQPVCCEPEPDCDVHAALVGMSDVGSVVDFAIDSLSPGQGMDMGQFDMVGAADSLGA
jgi:hypothetical protein